jgi:hypothetical protein
MIAWDQPPMLRPSEVKNLIGLSLRSVYRPIKAGKLRRHKIANATLIPTRDVQRLLRDLQGEPEAKLDPWLREFPRAR